MTVVAHDLGKLGVILVSIVSATVLLALGAIPDTAGVGIISLALGYVTGNGRLAVRREAPSPAIAPRPARPPELPDPEHGAPWQDTPPRWPE